MKKIMFIICSLGLLLVHSSIWAKPIRYTEQLCSTPGYHCVQIKQGESWEQLWPDPEQRDIVKRVNRMNIRLKPDSTIAVPDNLANLTIYDVAPFPRYIESLGEKSIYISQEHLAWAAYDPEGQLVWWGPVSSGTDCKNGQCQTPGGSYRIFRKQGIGCISTAFPRRKNGRNGGAKMPYCMHFYRGYALHGFTIVPGERASHGCIRMFVEDAKWLNEQFIELPRPHNDSKGTRIVVEGLDVHS